jgi:hypothetical protein
MFSYYFCLMIEGSGSVYLVINPDPGGQKQIGSAFRKEIAVFYKHEMNSAVLLLYLSMQPRFGGRLFLSLIADS